MRTPGNWEFTRCVKTENKRHLVEFQIRQQGSESLTGVVGWTDEARAENAERMEANAKLMAASPELSDSLKLCLELLDNSDVRDFIGRKMGDQSRLHTALKSSRKALQKAGVS